MVRAVRIILGVLAWVGAAAVTLFVLGAVFGVALTPWASFLSPLVLFLFIPVVVRAGRAVRRRRALAVATYVEQAVRLRVPIPRMLEIAQLGEGPRVAVRLRELRELIEAGAPLDVAIDEGVPEMSPRAVGLIGTAARTGRLESVLARLVAEGRRATNYDTTRAAFASAYPIMMGTFLLGIIVLISVFVFPKYRQIMKDFHMPLPPVTTRLMSVAEGVGPAVVLVMGAGALLYLGRLVWEVVRPFGAGARPMAAIGNAVWSTLPPTRFVIRDRDLGDVFEVMADATEAGVTLDGALREARRLYLGGPVRRVLRRWEVYLEAGRSVGEAARAAGMPGMVTGMLSSAVAAGGEIGDVLRFLSRYYRGRFSRVVAVARAAVVPVTVIVFAVPVVWVALSMFTPLVDMVDMLAASVRVRP